LTRDVFIDQGLKLRDRRRLDTVVVLTTKLCRLEIGLVYYD